MSKKFDKLLERATDSTLLDPAWENILLCVDSVKSGETQPKLALLAVRKRYRHDNPHTRYYSLLVLEAFVKNCGEKVHKEIATQEFMEDLKHLVEESQSMEKVKEKTLELIQCWSHAFRNKPEYKIVMDTHNLMKLEGYTFAPLRESDAMFDAESAPEWLDSDRCHRCLTEFGLLTRKHHCRNCGQVFCDKCSSRYVPLPHIGIETEVRVCEPCFDLLRSKQYSSAKISLAKMLEETASGVGERKISDTTKGGDNNDVAKPAGKSDAEREEEELQLALALSQSEADEKERKRNRSFVDSFDRTFTSAVSSHKPEPPSSLTNVSYAGTLDRAETAKAESGNESDNELSKYLNRGYWEARRSDQKKGILRNSPTPSAPVAPPAESAQISTVVLNGKLPENGFATNGAADHHDTNVMAVAPEVSDFVETLGTSLDVFVTRIRNDLSRGRSVVTDSSVQAMFVNLTSMHAQLFQHMGELEDKRGYFESLQDKLTQIKDAREAIDALREDFSQRRQAEVLELQRQRQIQMAAKVDSMRVKKHEMLEHQRLLAMRRIDEQRRDMELRRQQQTHHPAAQMYRGVDPMSMHQLAAALPSQYQNQPGTNVPLYNAPVGTMPAYQNFPASPGQPNPHMATSASQEFRPNMTSEIHQPNMGANYNNPIVQQQQQYIMPPPPNPNMTTGGAVPVSISQQPGQQYYGAGQNQNMMPGAYFYHQPAYGQQGEHVGHQSQQPPVNYFPVAQQQQQQMPYSAQPQQQYQPGFYAGPQNMAVPGQQQQPPQPQPPEAQLISFD